MTSRTTRTIALVAAFASAALLSGCAGGGAQPGVAARVGDATVSVSEVNRLSEGFCLAARREFESQGRALPMSVLSYVILQALTMNAVIDQLADDYDVAPSATFRQTEADRTESFAGLSPASAAEAAVLVQTSGDYRNDILTSIGRKSLQEEGVAEPSIDDSLARGNDILSVWLAQNEPEIDPQYHLTLDDGQASTTDTHTSFALTAGAVDALLADAFATRELVDDEQTRFDGYSRGLPESQRCG